MIFKRFSVLLAASILFAATLPFRSYAQSAPQSIKYGDNVTSEINDTQTAVSFSFSGNKNDVVLIQVMPIYDKDGKSISRPNILITNPKSKSAADSTQGTIVFFGGAGKFLTTQLDAKGDYTITVSRDKGDTAKGQFTLDLALVPLLKMDKAIEGTISTHTPGVRYPTVYAIQSTDDFGIEYTRKPDSKFNPSVTIHTVDRAGVPVPVISLAGSRLLGGTLNVEGSKDMYLVTVGDFENDTRSTRLKDDEQLAEFTIKLVAPTGGAPQ